MKKTLILAMLFSAGCFTGDDEAKSALVAEGYADVQIGGSALFSCGEHDKIGAHFTAKNVRGDTVSGVVCCGILKGCTVRH